MNRSFAAAALAFAPMLAMASSECRYSAERNFDVDAAGLATVAFALGSSDVVLEGVPGLTRVEVRGRACASDESWLEKLTVDQQRSGDRLEITPHDGHDLRASWFGSSYATVDLHVRMPAKLAADIKSQSGDAEVDDVASLEFQSSSGDLEVKRVAGSVGVQVSSGDVRGSDLGPVDVRSTASGDIHLRNVHGEVEVAHTGSGDLNFDTVGGVRIGSVGSGDVWVAHASGSVDVDSIGSGDVGVEDVDGDFRVGSKGSGDINHRNVRGTVSVPHDDNDDD